MPNARRLPGFTRARPTTNDPIGNGLPYLSNRAQGMELAVESVMAMERGDHFECAGCGLELQVITVPTEQSGGTQNPTCGCGAIMRKV